MTRRTAVFFLRSRKPAARALARRLPRLLAPVLVYPLLALVALSLTACDNDSKETPTTSTTTSAAPQHAAKGQNQTADQPQPADSDQALPLPTEAERAKADAVVAFYNDALNALASGRYGQADLLMVQTRYYLQEWQLLPRPEASGDEDRALARQLTPPAGLLPEADATLLVRQAEIMAKTAASIRADYRALERYVKDVDIQDDGVKGRALAASMEKAHAEFAAARESYVRTVEAHAVTAEGLLLRGHPLRRQILAAERVFAGCGAVARLLTPPVPDHAALRAQLHDLRAALATAGRPPFLAAPEVERLFRAFLKTAAGYETLLAQGVEAQFFSAPLRQRMNDAVRNSRAAYNAFVRAANTEQ